MVELHRNFGSAFWGWAVLARLSILGTYFEARPQKPSIFEGFHPKGLHYTAPPWSTTIILHYQRQLKITIEVGLLLLADPRGRSPADHAPF